MSRRLAAHLAVVGLPGVGFVIAGALSGEYPLVAGGCFLMVVAGYHLARQSPPSPANRRGTWNYRLRLVSAIVVGIALILAGFTEHHAWLVALGCLDLVAPLVVWGHSWRIGSAKEDGEDDE